VKIEIPDSEKRKKESGESPEVYSIGFVNWKEFPYKPEVKFQISHTGDSIHIRYCIKEKYVRALETRMNGEVYKDSCVEFFISFDGKNYYNFEFNCIGTVHLAYGSGRDNRRFVDPERINHIEIVSSLGNKPFDERKGHFEWELEARIPVLCFMFDEIDNLSGMEASANFYKCGDGTSEPHYITWNPVKTKNPDYHQLRFFGEIYFE
jgi:hypothetical protein